MPNPYADQWIHAPLLRRRQMRIALLKGGYRFSEPEKGFFIIEEPENVWLDLADQLRRQGLTGQ